MASRTRLRVSGCKLSGFAIARDTVEEETPARAATCFKLTVVLATTFYPRHSSDPRCFGLASWDLPFSDLHLKMQMRVFLPAGAKRVEASRADKNFYSRP